MIAAAEWGVNFEKMNTPPAVADSWENLLFKAGAYDKLLVFTKKIEIYLITQSVIAQLALSIIRNMNNMVTMYPP